MIVTIRFVISSKLEKKNKKHKKDLKKNNNNRQNTTLKFTRSSSKETWKGKKPHVLRQGSSKQIPKGSKKFERMGK